jgi:long-chain fatty acid transport protein
MSRWNRAGTLAALLCVPASALAGGFEVGENGPRAMGRGGAYVAGVDEPSAIYYNPAALSRIRGPAVTLNLNLMRADVSFQRSPFVITPDLEPDSPIYREIQFAEARNNAGFFPAPMLFASHDFGLEDWDFGVGVYGPTAVGRMDFDEMSTDAPTDENEGYSNRTGGQSYSIVSADLLLFYPSLSTSYRIDAANLSVGLTAQAAVMMVDYAVGVDGLSGPGSPEADSEEKPQLYTPNTLAVTGYTFTGILGLLWEPTDNWSFGASFRPRFKIRAQGDIGVEYPRELLDQGPNIADTDATLETNLPDVLRVGAQYTHRNAAGRELWDIEANVVYEGWSVNDGFRVELDGTLRVEGDAIAPQKLPNLFLPRYYTDSVSVRLGSDISVLRNENGNGPVFRLGAQYESSSSPNDYTNLDFLPFMRLGATAGFSYHLGPFALDIAGGYIWSPERTVENGKYNLLTPLWVCNDPGPSGQTVVDNCNQEGLDPSHPVNNGTYNVGFPMLSFGLTYGW